MKRVLNRWEDKGYTKQRLIKVYSIVQVLRSIKKIVRSLQISLMSYLIIQCRSYKIEIQYLWIKKILMLYTKPKSITRKHIIEHLSNKETSRYLRIVPWAKEFGLLLVRDFVLSYTRAIQYIAKGLVYSFCRAREDQSFGLESICLHVVMYLVF